MLTFVTKRIHAEIEKNNTTLYICKTHEEFKMITLSQPSKSERTYVAEAQRPAEAVETAGSLAMLFEDGLMTMGQYDEFISSNPFAVDYNMYSAGFVGDDSVAMGGFLSDFSNAVSALGGFTGGGFASAAGSFSAGSCGGGSCGGFSSVC